MPKQSNDTVWLVYKGDHGKAAVSTTYHLPLLSPQAQRPPRPILSPRPRERQLRPLRSQHQLRRAAVDSRDRQRWLAAYGFSHTILHSGGMPEQQMGKQADDAPS